MEVGSRSCFPGVLQQNIFKDPFRHHYYVPLPKSIRPTRYIIRIIDVLNDSSSLD